MKQCGLNVRNEEGLSLVPLRRVPSNVAYMRTEDRAQPGGLIVRRIDDWAAYHHTSRGGRRHPQGLGRGAGTVEYQQSQFL